MTDNQIEQEIQAKGKTAARVTPADIEANIANEHYFTAADGTMAVQANTSPAFPPVPGDGASPMTGIETADVGDNLEGMQP